MRHCMEINGKELKSKEENHNVQGIPHTQSQSSGGEHRISGWPHGRRGEGRVWRRGRSLSFSLIEQLASTARHIWRPQIHVANRRALTKQICPSSWGPLDDCGRLLDLAKLRLKPGLRFCVAATAWLRFRRYAAIEHWRFCMEGTRGSASRRQATRGLWLCLCRVSGAHPLVFFWSDSG